MIIFYQVEYESHSEEFVSLQYIRVDCMGAASTCIYTEVGKVTLKSNGDEALSDESL